MTTRREKSLVKKLWETAYMHFASDKPLWGQDQSSWGALFSGTTDDRAVNTDTNIDLNTDWAWKTFDIRSENFAKFDWNLVHVIDESDKVVIDSHKGIDLFYDVNDEYTEFDLWKSLQMSYDLFGEVLWYLPLDLYGQPMEIIPILPDMGKMIIERTKFGNIVGFRLQPKFGGEEIRFQPEEIFYYRCMDMSSSTRGLGLMNKLIRLARVDRGLKDYMQSFLENYGAASIHMSVDKALTTGQFNEARTRFRDEWAGSRAYRLPVFTDLGAKIEDFGQTVKELDFANSNNNIRDQIIQISGTPRYLYGITGSTTRADVEGQRIAFLENTMFPLLTLRDQRFSQDFWNKYYPQTTGRGGKLSMETIKPSLEDRVVELTLDEKRFGMGLMTVDEMAERQGLPKVGGSFGQKRFIATNLKEYQEQEKTA